jgi:hypothetical protein
MRVLIRNWGLRLPMASAILAVLYPSSFTVYDERVCDAINDFHDAKQLTNFDRLWDRYEEFLEKVNEVRRRDWTLRDADRFLWGQSFRLQLQRDLTSGFR